MDTFKIAVNSTVNWINYVEICCYKSFYLPDGFWGSWTGPNQPSPGEKEKEKPSLYASNECLLIVLSPELNSMTVWTNPLKNVIIILKYNYFFFHFMNQICWNFASNCKDFFPISLEFATYFISNHGQITIVGGCYVSMIQSLSLWTPKLLVAFRIVQDNFHSRTLRRSQTTDSRPVILPNITAWSHNCASERTVRDVLTLLKDFPELFKFKRWGNDI